MTEHRLGDHVKLIRGITFKPAQKCDAREEGAVACMRTKNVQVQLDQSDLIGVPREIVKNDEKILRGGDILVSSANSWNLVGKCCYVPRLDYPATAGGFISILRPTSENLDCRYLYRWFSSEKTQRKVRSLSNQTTNISNLDHKRTLELSIPFPSLVEQKRIAAILDEADALRAKRREAIAQLDTLIQSTFFGLFGDLVKNSMEWDEVSFGDCISNSFRNGLSPSTKGTVSGEVLTLSAITGSQFSFHQKKPANFDKAPSKTQCLGKNTFLICRGNGNKKLVGVGKFPDRDAGDVCFPDTMIGTTVDPFKISPSYLEMVWSSHIVRRQIERGARTTNGTYKVNQKLLSTVSIPVPPIELQRRFAAIVESVGRQKARMRAHLAELDALFASLQHRAFNGEL